jgi:hypothetical protein
VNRAGRVSEVHDHALDLYSARLRVIEGSKPARIVPMSASVGDESGVSLTRTEASIQSLVCSNERHAAAMRRPNSDLPQLALRA